MLRLRNGAVLQRGKSHGHGGHKGPACIRLRGFRIHAQDLALIVPAQSPIDGAVMLVEKDGHRNLRKIKKLDATTIMLQSYGREYDAENVQLNEITCVGRAVKVEFEV